MADKEVYDYIWPHTYVCNKIKFILINTKFWRICKNYYLKMPLNCLSFLNVMHTKLKCYNSYIIWSFSKLISKLTAIWIIWEILSDVPVDIDGNWTHFCPSEREDGKFLRGANGNAITQDCQCVICDDWSHYKNSVYFKVLKLWRLKSYN